MGAEMTSNRSTTNERSGEAEMREVLAKIRYAIGHSARARDLRNGALISADEADIAELIRTYAATERDRARREAMEEVAKACEATKNYDDDLQRSAGCRTAGERMALQIRSLSHPKAKAEDVPGWIRWGGNAIDEAPIPSETIVECKLADGSCFTRRADQFYWHIGRSDSIVAYHVAPLDRPVTYRALIEALGKASAKVYSIGKSDVLDELSAALDRSASLHTGER